LSPDRTTRKFLDHKVPPLVVLIIVAMIMWGASRLVPAAAFVIPYRIILCVVAIVVGVAIGATAIRSFRAAQTTVNPLHPDAAERLVSNGIYQRSRNPMYLGATFVLLALAVYLQNLMAFVTLPLFMIYLTVFQIRPEERVLAEKFGEEFQSYQRSVRRWL
jgi:protein-S-isoprenylcysteine O-methyltransferase Ste14